MDLQGCTSACTKGAIKSKVDAVMWISFVLLVNSPDKALGLEAPTGKHVTALVGRDAVLDCPLNFPDSLPVPYVIEWKRQDSQLPAFTSFTGYPAHVGAPYLGRAATVAGAASLRIAPVTQTDAGWYRCLVHFVGGTGTESAAPVWVHLQVRDISTASHASSAATTVAVTTITSSSTLPATTTGSTATMPATTARSTSAIPATTLSTTAASDSKSNPMHPCGQTTVRNGTIRSSHYPSSLLSGPGEIHWVILAEPGQKICLDITDLDLGPKRLPCGEHMDYLEIRDGVSGSAPPLWRVCGGTLSASVGPSSSSEITITWHAERPREGRSFVVSWRTPCGGGE